MNFHASQALLSCPFLGSNEGKKDSCEVEWSFSILDVTSQVSRPSDCYLWRIPQTNFCMRSEHRPFHPKAQPNAPNSDSDSLPVRSPKSIIGLLDLETGSTGETQGTDFFYFILLLKLKLSVLAFEDRVLF